MMDIISNFFLAKQLKKTFGIKKKKTKNVVLLEYFNYYPSLIGFGYFLKVLTKIKNAQVICYHPRLNSFWRKQYKKFKLNFSIISKLFRVIGVSKFLFIKRIIPKKILDNELAIISSRIKTKHDVIRLKCLGVYVGQQIYDEYVRNYNKTEVDVNDLKFRNLLIEMISTVYFWKKYFSKNNVKAVIVSHPVYFMGLISRVAITFNVPVYCVAAQNFFLITKRNFSKHSCCKKFSTTFKKILINKKHFIKLSEKELESRFNGKKDKKALLDQEVGKKLFDGSASFIKIIKDPKKINILVAAHCFSDGIHAYGKFFYTDFHDWLTFLGKVSFNSKYQFYIKIHPAEYDLNYEHFLKFKNKYNFIIIPKKITTSHVLKEKFDCVLTAYGSVGHEFPLFNMPVINASNNGPHSGYDFNINPKNKKHYEKIILNLKKNKFKIKPNIKNKIFEFYFMRYLSEYSLLDNWSYYISKLKNKYNSIEIIRLFLKNLDRKNHERKILDVDNFIKSKSLRLVADNSKQVSKLLTCIK
jgi:hypothetical protein